VEFTLSPLIAISRVVLDHLYRRPRIRVGARLSWAGGSYVRCAPGLDHLWFEVLNTGERPIVLAGCGYSWTSLRSRTQRRPDSWVMNGENFHTLEPGHRYRACVLLEREVREHPHLLRSVWARDTLDREYCVPKARLASIREELVVVGSHPDLAPVGASRVSGHV
jgi:hypothetical protein